MYQMSRKRGFTLIELMVVVAIIGLLAAVAIPSFMQYLRRSRTVEATENIRKIYDGLVAYWSSEHADGNGGTLSRHWVTENGQLGGNVLITPSASCCSPGVGVGGKCMPSPVYFKRLPWQALSFGVDDPFYFRYQIINLGTGMVPGSQAQIVAQADQNCDGISSLFQRTATVSSNYNVEGGAGIFSQRELE